MDLFKLLEVPSISMTITDDPNYGAQVSRVKNKIITEGEPPTDSEALSSGS